MADLRGVNPLGPAWATAPAVGGLSSGLAPVLETDDGTGSDSQFVRGFRSALTGGKSALQSYGGQLAELVGADQAAQEMNQYARENAALAEREAPRVRTVRQVMEGGDTLNDAMDYASGVIGQAGPYLGLGVAGGLLGRGAGLASGMRAGMTGEALAARAGATGNFGAAAAFHPVMAGDVAAQLRDDPAAAHMGVGERALRSNLVGGAQAAANAMAPAHMVNRTFARAPIAPGMMGMAQSAGRIGAGAAETAGLSGLGEMAEDVIGQTHQTQYDPNYRFNPEQTAEAGAAGFIGAGPTSIGHAAGVELLDTANAGVRQAGSTLGEVPGQIMQVAKDITGEAYEMLPAQAKDALHAVVAAGKFTADTAAALAPHAANLGSVVGDALKGFYENTKSDIEGYREDASIGLGPNEGDVAVDLAINTTAAVDQLKKEGQTAVKDFFDDPEVAAIAGPVKKIFEKAKNKLDGLTKVAQIMEDPAKWLHEGEKMTPEKLGQIRAAMNRPETQQRFASRVLDYLDSTPMEGRSAAEVRELATRTAAGEMLKPGEAARMYAQFKLASEAKSTADDMARVLKFDERLKAAQTTANPLPAQFSRQKTKAAEDQHAKEEADRVSTSFRNRVETHINEMFNASEVGQELLTREGGAQDVIAGMISFMASVAEGKKGYDTRAALSMASTITARFGPAGKAAIDSIIEAGDYEFGRDNKKSERVASMRDSITSMHTVGADIRTSLLKNKETDLNELIADVEKVRDVDANRESYQRAIDTMRTRADKEANPDRAFEMRAKAGAAEKDLMNGGLEGLKAKWVDDGVVDDKKFDALVNAISKYAKHEDNLRNPARRKANHATEANYAAEDLDDPDAQRAASEEADNDARPGKDRTEAEEVEDAHNAEQGVQGGEDRAAPIWFGTNAFDEGGHKANNIGAPLSRHPSGDYATGDIPGNQYNRGIETAHAKYGHRVTRAHGVRPLAWAEEMARTEGKKSDYEYLDDAMKALLKEDQKRLTHEKLTEEDRKWIKNRAELAERLLAQQEQKGGLQKFPAAGHFFAEGMNRNYRYYRIEQHDASNLSYSVEQLQAAYAVKEGETANAYAEREGARDSGAFAKKVYKDSLLTVMTAKGEVINVDVAKLVTNAIKHHQAGDITGVGDKAADASFAKEILTAFHTVVAALITGDGIHATDPLGSKTGTGSVFSSEDAKGVFGEHFDPSLVIFRDPTGRVLQDLGEHVKTASVRNFFTLGDLMSIKGVDIETGRTLRTEQSAKRLLLKINGEDVAQAPVAPGVFTQGDIDSVLTKVSQTRSNIESRRDVKAREAGNEKGVAHRGLTFNGVQKTTDVRALLARMIERNGMDPSEALYKGAIPTETVGHFLYEALAELKAMGFDGPLMDMGQTRFDNLVLFTREFTADDGSTAKYPVSFGAVKKYISTDRYKKSAGEPVLFERDLQDAKLREALTLLKAAEDAERGAHQRVARGEARVGDNDDGPIKDRAAKVTKGLGNTEFDKGQIDDSKADKALEYSDSEIDNFRLSGLLREFGEASRGDAPLFDRSANQLFLDSSQAVAKERKPLTDADIKVLKAEIQKHLTERAETAGPDTRKDVINAGQKEAPLNKPSAPYDAPTIPADVKDAAKIKSKGVVTNEKNLLAAAKAKREEEVGKAKTARAEQLALAATNAHERDRLATPEKPEGQLAPTKPGTLSVAKEFDAFAKADEFAATEAKTGRETVELVKTLSDEQLRDFAVSLPRMRSVEGTLAQQAYNVLGADGEFGMRPMAAWAKLQRERAGIRFNERTGKFEENAESGPGEAAFSKQGTAGTKDMFPGETKEALKKELTRLVKSAFGFEMPETMGKDVSGSFADKLIKVSQEATDPLGTLHHEVWHGIEKLLQGMGADGKKVLAEIYEHTSTPEVQLWLRTQYLGDGGVASQLTDKSERAAFAFQKFMAGEKMPHIDPATRTRWERIKAFIARVAAKLGIETSTNAERTDNFFNYVKDGTFARDMENAPAVRKGLGEKNGDVLMSTAATHLKPFVEAIETVLQHSDVRIRKLDIPEYNEVLERYAGKSGKGGYINEYNRNINKWLTKADTLMGSMDDAGKKAFLSSVTYRSFTQKVEAYMKAAKVGDDDVLGLYTKLATFNNDKINGRMEEFITDLQLHGGLKKDGAEARKIANQIADKGYFYDKDITLFKGHDDIMDKWLERSPEARVTRYIERAVYLAEQTRAFGDGETMRGKLDDLLKKGGEKSDPTGRKLVEDYTLAMEGRLGEGTMSPVMKKLMGTMLFANNVTILPMAVFSQMLDPMNMALRKNSMHGSLDALWRGVSEMPKTFDKLKGNYTPDYWEKLANQIGSAPARIVTNTMANLMNGMEINGTIGRLNETFFKYNFMDQWNRSMHIEATKHAVEFVREHAENVAKKQGGVDEDGALRSQRFLDELGLKHTDVKFNAADELVINDKIERALTQYVEEAMAHPDAGSNPMWMNDPRFAMLSQMKRFTFAHAKYVLGRGMKELSKGNAFPLAPMVIAMPWMMAADGMRHTLTGSEGYQATSALDEATHLAERAGHFGRGQFGLDVDAAISRGESPVEALMGPSIERFGNVARAIL